MKKNEKGRIRNKFLLIFVLIIILFNFIMPTYSKAVVDWGGVLWTPIQELVCGIGDVIFNLLQKSFIDGAPDAVFKATMSEFEKGESYGWLEARIEMLNATIFGGEESDLDYTRKEIVFPSIYYSVENIFANKIPAFDVNFINPSVENPEVAENGQDVKKRTEDLKYAKEISSKATTFDADTMEPADEEAKELENKIKNKITEIENKYANRNEDELTEQELAEKNWAETAKKELSTLKLVEGGTSILNPILPGVGNKTHMGKDYASIISSAYDNNINLGNIQPDSSSDSSSSAIGNIAKDLQPTIAKWYNAFRNLALVAMLSILVYIGIRITLGSTAQEQAKYKIMLKDWAVAICILFVMHYIMAFALNITEKLTDMLYQSYASAMEIQDSSTEGEENSEGGDEESGLTNSNGLTEITADTIASSVRVTISVAQDTGEAMGYTVMYAVFVIYTIIFTWQYLKRVIYMAFLTMIAPLVAMTYPLDKIRDGGAQGFDMWLKEYVFNLLLQPVHLLLYTMLMGAAIDLAKTSVVYSLIALGFLLEAVKIIKAFFGFDKASISNGGFASGFAGGALFSAGLNALKKIPKIGKHGSGSSGGKSSGESGKINFAAGSDRGSELKGLSAFNSENKSPTEGSSKNTTSKKETKKPKTKFKGILGGGKGTNLDRAGDQNPFATSKVSSRRANRKNSNARRRITGIAKGGGSVLLHGAKKFVPAAAKYSLAAFGAATLGTIGVAAGLASDDIGDVAKYGLVGVAGGFAVGKTAASSLGNAALNLKGGAGGISDTFKQGYYGEEYEAVKADEEWDKSKDVENHLKRQYQDEWKVAKDTQMQLRKVAGITDQKDLDIATKLLKNHKEMSIKEVGSAMKFKDATDMAELRDPVKRKAIEDKVNKLVPDEDKRKKVMSLMDEIHNV